MFWVSRENLLSSNRLLDLRPIELVWRVLKIAKKDLSRASINSKLEEKKRLNAAHTESLSHTQTHTAASLNHHRYRINAGWYAHKWLTYNNNNNNKKVRRYTQKGSFILIKFFYPHAVHSSTFTVVVVVVVFVIPLLANMFILCVETCYLFSPGWLFFFSFLSSFLPSFCSFYLST